jgi:nitrogen regulatory protein PII
VQIIKTIVRPHKMADVQEALNKLPITGVTLTEVMGCGAPGDGMVFVSQVRDSYGIRTGDWEG